MLRQALQTIEVTKSQNDLILTVFILNFKLQPACVNIFFSPNLQVNQVDSIWTALTRVSSTVIYLNGWELPTGYTMHIHRIKLDRI